jgi:hypothetical protein
MRSSRNSIKRDLVFGIILTALVFASALVFGGPFLATSPAPASTSVSAVQAPAHTGNLNGTLSHNGKLVYLSDAKGISWRLDNVPYVRGIEGRLVSVTGKLNSQTRVMHVEKIEPIDA